jgi:putative addiction module CopG family antidote
MAMRSTQQFSITLPNEMAELVRAKVAAGEYATESEVIRDGLYSLFARDQAFDTWLRTEVTAAYDEAKRDPSSLISSTEARARLAAWHDRAAQNDT